VSIKTRVRDTSETFMGDMEVQGQRHRTRLIHEVVSQLDVPTSLTPDPSHLFRFQFVGCWKEVSNLINHPVVSLLGTRVVGTITEVVPNRIDLKPPVTGNRHRQLRDSVRVGILPPTQETRNVCQRLADQVSSMKRGLICPANSWSCSTWIFRHSGGMDTKAEQQYKQSFFFNKNCLLRINKARAKDKQSK
jgi:hypothetical protein